MQPFTSILSPSLQSCSNIRLAGKWTHLLQCLKSLKFKMLRILSFFIQIWCHRCSFESCWDASGGPIFQSICRYWNDGVRIEVKGHIYLISNNINLYYYIIVLLNRTGLLMNTKNFKSQYMMGRMLLEPSHLLISLLGIKQIGCIFYRFGCGGGTYFIPTLYSEIVIIQIIFRTLVRQIFHSPAFLTKLLLLMRQTF